MDVIKYMYPVSQVTVYPSASRTVRAPMRHTVCDVANQLNTYRGLYGDGSSGVRVVLA